MSAPLPIEQLNPDKDSINPPVLGIVPEKQKRAQFRRKRGPNGNRKKWNPVIWKPEYEEMIQLRAQGWKIGAIASHFNVSYIRVFDVLNSDHGKLRRQEIVKALQEVYLDRQQKLAVKAMDRIEEVLNDDDLAMTKPLAIFDRGLAYMKAIGNLKSDESTATVDNSQNVTNNFLNIGNDAVATLIAGLNKSNKARELHSGLSGDSIR